MARFGLDSDSSDDEVPHASGSGSGSGASSRDQSEDEAPPRASLAQSDDEMTGDDYDQDHSQLDEDEDEDDEFSDGYVEEPSYLAQRARSTSRALSHTPSGSNLAEEEELSEDEVMSGSQRLSDDSTSTVADQVEPSQSNTPGRNRGEAWGKKLGLEAKRVAVMQASFFGQSNKQQTNPHPHTNTLAGLKRSASVVNPFAPKSTPAQAPGQESAAPVSTSNIAFIHMAHAL